MAKQIRYEVPPGHSTPYPIEYDDAPVETVDVNAPSETAVPVGSSSTPADAPVHEQQDGGGAWAESEPSHGDGEQPAETD